MLQNRGEPHRRHHTHRRSWIRSLTLAVLVIFVSQACSVQPWRPQAKWENETFEDTRRVRVHRSDGTEVVLTTVEVGEDEEGKFLAGQAPLSKKERRELEAAGPEPETVKIYYSEITLVETRSIEQGRILANAGLTVVATVAVLGILAAIAVASLSACPLAYSFDGSEYHLESETFANAFAPELERTVYDTMRRLTPVDGRYHLRIENRSLETHYLDQIALFAVHHPPDVQLGVLGASGEITGFRKPTPPLAALDGRGQNVLGSVRDQDGRLWESEASVTGDSTPSNDSLRLRFKKPQGGSRVRVLVVGGNSPYAALEISRALDRHTSSASALAEFLTSPQAAGQLTEWIERTWYWSIHVTGSPPQALPLIGAHVHKQLVYEFDIANQRGDEIEVVLAGRAGGWSIDQVAADYTESPDLYWKRLPLLSTERDRLDHVDGGRSALLSGDTLDLTFRATPEDNPMITTPVLVSRGYYLRWPNGTSPAEQVADRRVGEEER